MFLRKVIVTVLFVASSFVPYAQTRARKLIDMHLHCYDSTDFTHPMGDPADTTIAKSEAAHFKDTYNALQKSGAVKAVISGTPTSVEAWMARDTRHIFIRGLLMYLPAMSGIDTVRFEQMIKEKKIEVFGELGTYYSGTTLSDSVWQPYLRICEKYDVPVAVHQGGGPPEAAYHGAPAARLRLTDPFLIEDVLVRYPKLRLYMMHAGEIYYEHAIRLMMTYPQLYADIGALLWVTPYTQRYATEFLKQAKEAGCLNRVMYGTDQMVWPHAIEKSIRFLEGLAFLTKQDKEAIFYDNAARFLRLTR